ARDVSDSHPAREIAECRQQRKVRVAAEAWQAQTLASLALQVERGMQMPGHYMMRGVWYRDMPQRKRPKQVGLIDYLNVQVGRRVSSAQVMIAAHQDAI